MEDGKQAREVLGGGTARAEWWMRCWGWQWGGTTYSLGVSWMELVIERWGAESTGRVRVEVRSECPWGYTPLMQANVVSFWVALGFLSFHTDITRSLRHSAASWQSLQILELGYLGSEHLNILICKIIIAPRHLRWDERIKRGDLCQVLRTVPGTLWASYSYGVRPQVYLGKSYVHFFPFCLKSTSVCFTTSVWKADN